MPEQVWNNWIQIGNTTTATTMSGLIMSPGITVTGSSSVWHNWVSTSSSTTITFPIYEPVDPAPVVDLDHIERLLEAQAARRAAEQAAAAERLTAACEAKKRARELLRFVLTAEQWDDWENSGSFTLRVRSGHEYRIRSGVAGNITRILDGLPVERLCAHPSTACHGENGIYTGQLPIEDSIITQVLALRTDENGFRETANITILPGAPLGLRMAA